MQAEHPPGDSANPHKSPYAGLDYPEGMRPRAGELGRLALSIGKLYGVTGPHALAAAILLDQGRASNALELLAEVLAEREVEDARRKHGLPRAVSL